MSITTTRGGGLCLLRLEGATILWLSNLSWTVSLSLSFSSSPGLAPGQAYVCLKTLLTPILPSPIKGEGTQTQAPLPLDGGELEWG